MKKVSLLSMLLIVALGVSANAGVIYNPCNTTDGLVYNPVNPTGDFGIHATGGPDGSSSVYFVPRDTGGHSLTWDYADTLMKPGDTISFDIKNVLALEGAHLSVWTWYNDGAGESIFCPANVDYAWLGTNDWQHFTITVPAGLELVVTRTQFVITESTKVLDLDNLTLTTVPEPATMALLGLGGLLLRKKK